MKLRIAALLTGIGALGCHGAPLGPPGLTFTLAVARTALLPGQPDTISVTLTNTTSDPIALTVGGCPMLFYVIDGHGNRVVPTGDWVCIASIGRMTLAPGAQLVRAFVWETAGVAPGAFTVYGTFTAQGFELQTARVRVQVQSVVALGRGAP